MPVCPSSSCLCIHLTTRITNLIFSPILTYQRQGTGKSGVLSQDHAIIYTGNDIPPLMQGESDSSLRGPIRVEPRTPRDKLDPASRLNYSKIYTVEHNVKVKFIGRIASGYQQSFMVDFDAVWESKTKINTGGNGWNY